MKIVREHITEAFEKKSKDVAKRELLYPEIADIDSYWALGRAMKKGIPIEAIPEERMNDLFRNTPIGSITYFIDLLKDTNISFPQEIIEEHIRTTNFLSDLEELSEIGDVKDEDINRVIVNSEKYQWEIWIESSFPGIDPCTGIEIGYTSLRTIDNDACEMVVEHFINGKDIQMLPDTYGTKLWISFQVESGGGEQIGFEFFLKRKYKTKDKNAAWQQFLNEYFPKKKEICGWELNA
jgi:hypothetical protein